MAGHAGFVGHIGREKRRLLKAGTSLGFVLERMQVDSVEVLPKGGCRRRRTRGGGGQFGLLGPGFGLALTVL
jgi:hypothetical protein